MLLERLLAASRRRRSPRSAASPSFSTPITVSTFLAPERVADALGAAMTLSFWDLPSLIEVAEKAGLSASRFRVQYELLLSRPLLCMVTVLLAATVSLRSFRGGGIQTMVIVGMLGGFSFFLLSEVSRQVGIAGLAPPCGGGVGASAGGVFGIVNGAARTRRTAELMRDARTSQARAWLCARLAPRAAGSLALLSCAA